jgi:hypothetical protein
MILSETCAPVTTIEQKLAERNVLIVESNALNTLRLSKKNSVLERELAKEYYDYLDYKVLVCDKGIYRVFYEEIPADSPERAKTLDKIEWGGVASWTYKSEIPIKQNPMMDVEAYKALSYSEKVERKIAEHNILDTVTKAITVRRKAEITEFESKLLNEHEFDLTGLTLACIKEIWHVSWGEVPQYSPDAKEIDKRIEEANITQQRYDSINNARKILVKTCLN